MTGLAADPAREEEELRRYLAADYDRRRLEGSQALLDEELRAVGDEATFYRTSEAYLYDLTVFAMSGTKIPYLQVLTDLLPAGARVLDYGCGIGSDGLMLLEAGYRVEFADFANPSTKYLAWRLEQRGLSAPIHDLDGEIPGGYDGIYSFDVIEHVRDPLAFVGEMESRARLVMVNLLEFDGGSHEAHYELPIGALLRRAARRRLQVYRLFYGTSHLVAYDPRPATPLQAAANLARVAAVRARQRLTPA